MRTGNCSITTADASSLDEYVADIKKIICNDSDLAASTLRDFGTIQHNHIIVKPRGGVDFAYTKPCGDTGGFTLKSSETGMREFLNIHSSLSKGPR